MYVTFVAYATYATHVTYVAYAALSKAEIEKDLHRTFPNHRAFDEGGEGRNKLRDILTAYSLRNHNVGYCQSLNYVAAMLLIALKLDAEAAFWMLATLCEDLFPDFYSHNMTGIRIEQQVFSSFVKEISPQVHAHFEQLTGAVAYPLHALHTPFHTRYMPATCPLHARYMPAT